MNCICLIVKGLLQINKCHFSKIVLEKSRNKNSVLGLQYKPENFDVSKVCFAK